MTIPSSFKNFSLKDELILLRAHKLWMDEGRLTQTKAKAEADWAVATKSVQRDVAKGGKLEKTEAQVEEYLGHIADSVLKEDLSVIKGPGRAVQRQVFADQLKAIGAMYSK